MRQIAFLILILILIINNVSAESGTIAVSSNTELEYTQDVVGGAQTVDWTKLYIKVSTFNDPWYFTSQMPPGASFAYATNETSFHCVTNCTGTGNFVYTASDRNVTYYFFSVIVTGTPFTLAFDQPTVPDQITPNCAGTGAKLAASVSGFSPITDSKPMGLILSNGVLAACTAPALSQWARVGSYTTNAYNFTYSVNDVGTFFTADINKSMSALDTKVILTSASTTYFTESTFNKLFLHSFNLQKDGIYLNVSISNGASTKILINSSGGSSTSNPSTGNINFNKTAYSLGEQMNVSYSITNGNTAPYHYVVELYKENSYLSSYSLPALSGYYLPVHDKTTAGTYRAWLFEVDNVPSGVDANGNPVYQKTFLANNVTQYGQGVTDVTGNISTDKSTYNRTELTRIRFNISTNGRLKIVSPVTEYLYAGGPGTNLEKWFYIPEDAAFGTYTVYLQYYDGINWNYVAHTVFTVSEMGSNKIEFQTPSKQYMQGETMGINAIATEDGYVKLIDSSGKTKFNSSITASTSSWYTYFVANTDPAGTWTVNLYNSTSVIVASDTATVYTTGPTPTVTIPGNVTPGVTVDYVGNRTARRAQENSFLNSAYGAMGGLFGLAVLATMMFFLKKLKW